MDQGGSVMGALTDGTVGTLRREMHGHEPVVCFAGNGKEDRQSDDGVCMTLKARMGTGGGNVPLVAFKENAGMEFPSQTDKGETSPALQAQNQMAVAIGTDLYNGSVTGDVAATITTHGSSANSSGPTVAVAMVNMQGSKGNAVAQEDGPSFTLSAMHGHDVHAVATSAMQVRRLTPRECERLQGFPDDYTQVPHRGKPAADGPRYKALGNSMAVPCMAWIGRRIQMFERQA
jgi:DNA (cytosine-5)-methyltransferase 1